VIGGPVVTGGATPAPTPSPLAPTIALAPSAVPAPAVSAVTGEEPPPSSDPPGGPITSRPTEELQQPDLRNQLAEVTQADLTAPDGFIYDFSLTDVDYIPAETSLPHGNLTQLPAVPTAYAAAYNNNPKSDNPLLTWRLDKLQHNKELWDKQANRKIKDAVRTLIGQVLLLSFLMNAPVAVQSV
jgi:hypothetical protein